MSALRAALVFVLLLWFPAPSPSAQQISLEYEVKAAFLLNFARYVEWPPKEQTPPLRLCVFRGNPFGTRLDALVTGERWQGGPIHVHLAQDLSAARGCHLLYVPKAETNRYLSIAAQLSTLPVLTVGETSQFLNSGGMIQLFLDANRVRFSINQRAATEAGLQISSRLLRLASTVVGDQGAQPE